MSIEKNSEPQAALAYGGSSMTAERLQTRMDLKTKPLGALGALEALAVRIGLALESECPRFVHPTVLVFAADHGITAEGVSAYPADVTVQMVRNFLAGGAAINVLARQHGLRLTIIDAGLSSELPAQEGLIDRAVARSTRNCRLEPAMTAAQCRQALDAGREIARATIQDGANAVLLGEMGIGNTAASALLLHRLTGWPLADCVGRGTGVSDEGLARKRQVLESASNRRPDAMNPLDTLAEFGGFEIAMLTGAILETTQRRCVTVMDGFSVSVAVVMAQALGSPRLDRCVFSHCSDERAHRRLLAHLGVKPLLDLGLRLGEASGAALAWPLIDSAARLLSDMASFESAGVSNRADG